MHLIPVIDLKNGQVVHARMGQRHLYKAIESTICNGSEPINIIKALIELYPFTHVYIADIDAIQNNGNNQAILKSILKTFPMLNIWLDAGNNTQAIVTKQKNEKLTAVLGSESLHDYTDYLKFRQQPFILSLDFTDTFKGPPELLIEINTWPENIICMTLNQVGSGLGPDVQKLAELKARYSHNIYAAGGIRDTHDLQQLNALGIHGALVATALHTGALSLEKI